MKSNYKKIGDYVCQVNNRNTDLKITNLKGININKEFMPSVANINGTDLSKYKIVKKEQFAFNPMHVGRDEVLPISLWRDDEEIIVSPAYTVLEITDTSILNPEYLMMWFERSEFDRNCWFTTDNSVRGGFNWDDFCNIVIPLVDLNTQNKIVEQYFNLKRLLEECRTKNSLIDQSLQNLYKKFISDYVDENQSIEDLRPLGDYCSLITKGTTPKKMDNNYFDKSIIYIKGTSIDSENFIDLNKVSYIDASTHSDLKRSQIKPLDILYTITGTLGNFALVPQTIPQSNTNQNVAIIRVNSTAISSYYLYFLFTGNWHNKFLIENTQQAVQANLNLKMLNDMLIPILPETIFKSLNLTLMKLCEYKLLNINKMFFIEKLQEVLLQEMSVLQ